MTARLLASKCSQTVEAVADVGNHCTHTSVKVYDGYAYDDCSHLSWFSAKIHSNNCSLCDCRVNHHYSFVCVFCENLSKKNWLVQSLKLSCDSCNTSCIEYPCLCWISFYYFLRSMSFFNSTECIFIRLLYV